MSDTAVGWTPAYYTPELDFRLAVIQEPDSKAWFASRHASGRMSWLSQKDQDITFDVSAVGSTVVEADDVSGVFNGQVSRIDTVISFQSHFENPAIIAPATPTPTNIYNRNSLSCLHQHSDDKMKHVAVNPSMPTVAIWLYLVILTSGHSDAQPWASECPDVKNYRWRLNPVWHRMLYGCNYIATVGVKGLKAATHTGELVGN